MTTRDEILAIMQEAGFSPEELSAVTFSCWPCESVEPKPALIKLVRLAQAAAYEDAANRIDRRAFVMRANNTVKGAVDERAELIASILNDVAKIVRALKDQA